MSVLQNANSMFFYVNDAFQADKEILQEAHSDMLVMLKLLNESLFNLCVYNVVKEAKSETLSDCK